VTEQPSGARRRGWRWYAPRMGAALASVALTLAALEVGMRLFVPEGRLPFAAEQLPAGVTQPDDELGWRMAANLDVTYPTNDGEGTPYEVHLSFDADGFRNCGPSESTDAECPVLLCVGDSFTAAGEVSDGETWYCRAAELLGARARGFGSGGYGTLQELTALRRHIGRVDPDIVVLQWCSNDFVNNSRELELRSFANNHAMRRPYRTPDGGVEFAVPQTLGGLRRFARTRSRLAGAALALLDRSMASREGVEDEIKRVGIDHAGLRRSMETSATLLRDMREACGDRPLFVFEVTDEAPWNAALAEICDEAGVERIPGVAEAVDADGLKAKANDKGHWSPLGHDIAAQRIAAYLREKHPELFAATP